MNQICVTAGQWLVVCTPPPPSLPLFLVFPSLLVILLIIVWRAHLSWVGPISRRQQAAQNWAISCSCHKCSTPSPPPSLPLFTPVITFYLICVCVCVSVRRGQFALRLFSCNWNWNYLLANWRTCWDWGKPRWPSAPLGEGQTDRQIESVDECFGRISKFALSSYTYTNRNSQSAPLQVELQPHTVCSLPLPLPCPALPRKQTKSALSFICGKFSTCYRLGSSAKK